MGVPFAQRRRKKDPGRRGYQPGSRIGRRALRTPAVVQIRQGRADPVYAKLNTLADQA
jgi:hypothetical protein